jgi:hypothetical protein
MNGEQKIIVAGVVILVFGIGKAALDKKPLDVPLIGGIAFILLLSLVSAFGQSASSIAGNFALAGMTIVLLVDGPEVVQTAQKVYTPPAQTKGPGPAGIVTAS